MDGFSATTRMKRRICRGRGKQGREMEGFCATTLMKRRICRGRVLQDQEMDGEDGRRGKETKKLTPLGASFSCYVDAA